MSIATALNSMQRVSETLNSRKVSTTGLYSSNRERLKLIRQYAEDIMVAANDILGRVGESDPRYFATTCSSENLEKVAELAAEKALERVMGMDTQPRIENASEGMFKAEEARKGSDGQDFPTRHFAKNFKRVLSRTATTMRDSADIEASKCADMVDKVFRARFDSKNDPDKLHRFDRRQFRNYLAALVIDFSLESYEGKLDAYLDHMCDWVEAVKCGSVRFTLPPSASKVFFTIAKPEKCTDPVEISDHIKERASRIWESLWHGGYFEFAMLGDEPDGVMPTHGFDWFDTDGVKDAVSSLPNGFTMAYDSLRQATGKSLSPNDLSDIDALWGDYQKTTLRPDYLRCQRHLLDNNEVYRAVYDAFDGDMVAASLNAFILNGMVYGVDNLKAIYNVGYKSLRSRIQANALTADLSDIPDNWFDVIGIFQTYFTVMLDGQ